VRTVFAFVWTLLLPLHAQIQQHGWKSLLLLFGTTTTSNYDETRMEFWKLPGTWPDLWHSLSSCQQQQQHGEQQCTKIVIDVLYPLFCGVGAIVAVFLGQHVKYLLHGRTTLEHRVVLEQ
jgi:hypothetical protein